MFLQEMNNHENIIRCGSAGQAGRRVRRRQGIMYARGAAALIDMVGTKMLLRLPRVLQAAQRAQGGQRQVGGWPAGSWLN